MMTDILSNPTAQPVYALALSSRFASDGVLFAATGQGLLLSADHGLTFTNAYDSLDLPTALPTAAVALSPIYDQDRTVFAGVTGAILRSRDGGERWQYASLRNPPPAVTCLAVSPEYEKDGVVFAGTLEDGVFRSADRGATWASWNFGLIDLAVLCLTPSPAYGQDDRLFVGTETGLFRSANGGRAWRETDFPTEMAPVLCLAVSPRYENDGTVYAGTESAGLWVSHDAGKTWAPSPARAGGTINALAFDPEDGKRLAVLTDDALLMSKDGGATFEEIPLAVAGEASPVCLAATGDTLLVGTSDGRIAAAAW